MQRRKLRNPLALAVLATLRQKPVHPYEMAQTLRCQGKDSSTTRGSAARLAVVVVWLSIRTSRSCQRSV
ncbi:hypothetical protein [Streptomyces sp. NPDC058307]|uniref:hypothetical protein n=1 Tax=Streptomyces sp. NPDC058307 TaxID=3346439 RepID=UPI0036E13C80